MANYTHLSSLNVQGAVETSTQGKLVGSFDTMPAATALNSGQIVLYSGPTDSYIQGKYYVSNGTDWVLSAASPVTTVDSELSDTSTDPVQNKVIKAELDSKVPVSGTYDADNAKITFLAASGTQLFEVTGIESGGIQFTLEVDYTGATDLSGIVVTATPTSGTTATVQGITNSNGKAFLAVKQNVTYRITSSKSGYAFSSTPEVSCIDLTTTVSISCYVPGIITITVVDGKGFPVEGRTVTATASGQTTQTKTVASGQTSVTFSLPAGKWTFQSDYPEWSMGSTIITQAIKNNEVYSESIKIVYSVVYGVRISINTSDPKERVTYPPTIFGLTNEAASFAKGTGPNDLGGWAGCALISGIRRQTVSSSLKNPTYSDFTEVANRRSAVAGNSSTDVVTYFPTCFVKMTNDGTNIDFAFCDEQIDSSWKDHAGSVGSNRVGYFRLGCFCSPISSAVKSYGGAASEAISLTDAITYTQIDRGTGFDLMTWYQWTYIVMLMTAIFGTTDLQSVLGKGVSNSPQSSQTALSFSNDYGMYGSTSDESTQMAFFWLQNIYGDLDQWVGGAFLDSAGWFETNTGYSSTSSFDLTSLFKPYSIEKSGAVQTVSGTTDTGFLPNKTTGSYSTYFADYGYPCRSCFPIVGGKYNNDTRCGPFCVFFTYNSTMNAVRLSYRL